MPEGRNKTKKAIDRLVPDYNKLQQFTAAIIEIEPGLPKLIFWNPAELTKSWGTLSKYLHWFGASIETNETASRRKDGRSEAGTGGDLAKNVLQVLISPTA